MMVKSLDTLVAVVAVHCVLRPQVLTINTYVVKMELFIDKTFHQTKEIFF